MAVQNHANSRTLERPKNRIGKNELRSVMKTLPCFRRATISSPQRYEKRRMLHALKQGMLDFSPSERQQGRRAATCGLETMDPRALRWSSPWTLQEPPSSLRSGSTGDGRAPFVRWHRHGVN
ncbi:uncharacterized protein CIMG_05193 [Coccidioides immitis RS]|uniref:Uncharacterized protein n=2 Tax=Coccidioides immitis TaxID=5501 RepID=A0A0E1S3R8_COCIM|nr:uncharacterized protein CIMG_05193 [Coccidioides immitis RS]EAS34169.1 hypothetical protein CIMG_05193 [Coccidioides immitis RS]KMP05365.1 hypothetical protein CIRG_05046 [Coccidioides immitis RMSCC 2394]